MRPTLASSAERMPARLRLAHQASTRTQLAAGAAVAALLAQVLLAQLTLALLICFMIIGRLSRWRPLWLAVPAAAGLSWVLTIGLRPALGGYLAGADRVISYLTGSGPLLLRLAHLPAAFASWPRWLPGQLPIALLAAAAQAACLKALSGADPREQHRPGIVIAVRRRYLAAMIRRGEVATSDGGCVGVDGHTGRRAAISWREAESGVLCVGQDAAAVAATGLELALAAIQLRKAVIIVDSVNGIGLAHPIARACAEAGAPLRCYGDSGGCYQPLSDADPSRFADPSRSADPARAAGLVLAMIDWSGVSNGQRRFCADYLNAAVAVAAAGQPTTDLGELIGLLQPDTLRARLRELPPYSAGTDALTRRVADLVRQLEADPAALAPLATQLTGLRSTALGHWLRPARAAGSGLAGRSGFAGSARFADPLDFDGSTDFLGQASFAGPVRRRPAGGETQISFGPAMAAREVVLFPLDRRAHGRGAAMIARLAVADLIANLADRKAQASPGDCLIWINGCEALDPRQLATLIALGPGAGTAVLLGTAVQAAAARIARQVNVIVIRGPAPPAVAALVAAADSGEPAFDPSAGSRPGGLADSDLALSAPDHMMVSEPGPPVRFPSGNQDSAGSLADLLLGQRPDALSLLVRNPYRLLLRCWAAR